MKKEPGNLPEGEKGLLAGDIGGTKTHLGLYAIDAGLPRKLATVSGRPGVPMSWQPKKETNMATDNHNETTARFDGENLEDLTRRIKQLYSTASWR